MLSEQLLHRDVLDPGLHELPPAGQVPGPLVERSRVGLRVQHDAAGAAGRGSPGRSRAARRERSLAAARSRCTASRLNWTVGPTNSSRQVATSSPSWTATRCTPSRSRPSCSSVRGHALLDAEDLVAKRKRSRRTHARSAVAPDLEVERGIVGRDARPSAAQLAIPRVIAIRNCATRTGSQLATRGHLRRVCLNDRYPPRRKRAEDALL